MSTIIRGSQLVEHSVRMGVQSIKGWITLFCCMWLLIFSTTLYVRLDKIHVETLYRYCEAWFYRMVWSGDEVKIHVPIRSSVDPHKQYYATSFIKNGAVLRELDAINTIMLKSVMQAMLTSLMCIAAWIVVLRKIGSGTKQERFIRGSKLVNYKELIRLVNKYNKKHKYKSNYNIVGIPYPAFSAEKHTLICGTTGSGKSLIQKALLEQIIANGDRAIVYDFTGAYVESFYREGKDIILNPFDARGRAWSILEEVRHMAEFDTIAAALIGEKWNAKDRFWIEGARIIFKELCKLHYRAGCKSTKQLLHYLHRADLKELSKDLEGTSAKHLVNPNNKETTMGLMASLASYLSALHYVKEPENGEACFSIKDWIQDSNQDNVVYLSTKANLASSIYPLISAMMDIAINNMMNLSTNTTKKTWFVFDEIASLNQLPSLRHGLSVTRNFGGCFVIGIQERAQLIEIYGKEGADTITSNCGTKLLLKAGEVATARWSSSLIGSKEIMSYRENISYGAHEIRDGVNLNQTLTNKEAVLESEFLSMCDLSGYIILPGNFPTAQIKIKHKSYPVRNLRFMPSMMEI